MKSILVLMAIILSCWNSYSQQKCYIWNIAPGDQKIGGVINNFKKNIQITNPGYQCVLLPSTKARAMTKLKDISSDDVLVIIGHGDMDRDLIGPANIEDPNYNYTPKKLIDLLDDYVDDYEGIDDDQQVDVYIKCCYTKNFADQCNALNNGPSGGKFYFLGEDDECEFTSDWQIPH